VSDVIIDIDKCVGCGACVAECPAYVLALANEKSSVVAAERCIVCGHCAAVCPQEAISLSGFGSGEALDHALMPEPGAVMELIRSRRSVRAYTDEPVSDEDLKTLLDAARYAPTGHNAQAWHFTVIRGSDKMAKLRNAVVDYMDGILHTLADRQRREQLAAMVPADVFEGLQEMVPSLRAVVQAHRAGLDVIFRGAPALIVLHVPRVALTGVEDCHYGAGNIMLMAHAMGLGTCLVGFLVGPARNSREISAAIGIPRENEVAAALVIGHPKYRYRRVAPRREVPVTWE
jgi:nitroreductase/NAD-dependent dihydropyrimidine dehydrogenase PreA subunit